jgi:hypothetical protein
MSSKFLTTSEKVKTLLKDPYLRDSILEEIMNQDTPISSSLKIEIKSDLGINYQLIHEDISKILQFYGEVSELKIVNNIAFLTFRDTVPAYFAQKTLNNKFIPAISSTLLVTSDESQQSFITDLNKKYTCKFEIQIDNEKDFQVARRLIGPKGNNMKKIGEMCARGKNCKNMHDFVKLRLRGKGSGFREGVCKEESNENLHLCVSSMYYEQYKIACDEITKLILQVYKDYYNYCRNKGIKTEILRIKKFENIQE